MLEYDLCLGVNWMKKANHIIDHKTGRIVGRSSGVASWRLRERASLEFWQDLIPAEWKHQILR